MEYLLKTKNIFCGNILGFFDPLLIFINNQNIHKIEKNVWGNQYIYNIYLLYSEILFIPIEKCRFLIDFFGKQIQNIYPSVPIIIWSIIRDHYILYDMCLLYAVVRVRINKLSWTVFKMHEWNMN